MFVGDLASLIFGCIEEAFEGERIQVLYKNEMFVDLSAERRLGWDKRDR